MRRRELRERLGGERAPGEHEAGQRSWEVVRRASARRGAQPRRHVRRGFFGGLLAAVAAIALVLTPAGAQVTDWVREIVDPPGIERAKPALESLPGGGRLLVDSASGSWLVDSDGSKRRLGDYDESAWSPRGLYAAMAEGNTLTAVDVHDEIGEVRWSIAVEGRVHDQAWAPSGQRIAYLAGRELRVIAGDGTDDRTIDPSVTAVRPAWKHEREYGPGSGARSPRHVLAYLDADGRTVRVVRVDTGREIWADRVADPVVALAWTDAGDLAVLDERGLQLHSARGETEGQGGFGGFGERKVPIGATAGPDGQVAVPAFLPDRRKSTLEVFRPPVAAETFRGPGRFSGATYGPGAGWILLEWKAADQWLFVSPDGRRVRGVSGISEQFDPGGTDRSGFPAVSGWCCR